MDPKISIVVTCYNHERYIEECLQSLLRQVLKPFEIIVTDDASTDRSPEIIESFAEQHPTLIRPYLHSKNMGMNANTLFGASKIKGDLCCLIDGDDRFHPLKLIHEWEAMEAFPDAAIAYSNLATINADGIRTSILGKNGPTPPSGFILPRVFGKTIFPHSASLYRHELMQCHALDAVDWIDSSVGIFSDWDMRIRLAAKFPVAYAQDVLVEYRLHDKGMHNDDVGERVASMKRVFEKNLPLLDDYPEDIRKSARESALKIIDRVQQKGRPEAAPSRKLVITI